MRRGRRKPEGSAWASSSTRMTGPASSVMAGRTASRKTPTAGRSSIGADRFRTPTDVVSYDERVDRPHRAGSERPETIGHPLTPEASHGAAFGCGADGRRARDKRRPSSMETGRDRPVLFLIAIGIGGPAPAGETSRPSEADLKLGRELFSRQWRPNDPRCHGGDGLGPVYNATSCVACHGQGGPGARGPRG